MRSGEKEHQSTRERPLVAQEGQRPAKVLGATPPSLPAGEVRTLQPSRREVGVCRKDGRPGAQAPSRSPCHPRPEARAAASLPISSQAADMLTCFPSHWRPDTPKGCWEVDLPPMGLLQVMLISILIFKKKNWHFKHSGPYRLWAHRARCYPSNNSPKCSIL